MVVEIQFPRIVLSGTSSRAGKTVVSIGLMRALKNRGYNVQPYKIGPDFIDPSYHLFATRRPSRNLDSYMMGREDIIESFERNFKDADIAVIEGTMGLYDSHNAIDEKGSTAEVSKILKAPVILIANVERISRTAAAFVLGYKVFDRDVDIKGAILNRVGSDRHADKAKRAVEGLANIAVMGVMPRDSAIEIPERHLGLVPAFEREKLEALFDRLADLMEKYIDIDRLIEIAKKTPDLKQVEENSIYHKKERYDVTLGIVRDKVFTFYYEDTIDAFMANANVKYIDSLNDTALPEIDGLYIGGGFPEIFAEDLEKNSSLREDIKEFCDAGKPVYAECGGLMYLGKSIITKDEREYEMAGFLPIKTRMHKKFQALGYVRNTVVKDNPLSRKGDRLVGHEFHNSTVEVLGDVDFVYEMRRGKGIDGKYDGILLKNTLASYLHVHVLSYPQMVTNFLGMCKSTINR